MRATTNDPVDWFALGSWFQRSGAVMDDLSACADQSQALVDGAAGTDPSVLGAFETGTRRAAAWFALQPCPELWVRDFTAGIVDVLGDIAELAKSVEPAPSVSHDRFVAKVVRARLMIRELRSIGDRLHVYAGLDPQMA